MSASVIALGAVDDHPVVLQGIAASLKELAPDVQLVATATDVRGLLVLETRYDVVLLDLRLGDGSSPAENTARLRAAGAEVLVYTEGAQVAQASAAVGAGALGVLLKEEPVPELCAAVRLVARGEAVVSARLARALEAAPRLADLLTDQERTVLRLYAGDLPAKSVGRRLGMTEDGVKECLKRVRSKLAKASVRANTKLELRDVAEVMGLVDGGTPQLRSV